MTIILKFLFLFLDVAKDEIEVRDEYDFAIMKKKSQTTIHCALLSNMIPTANLLRPKLI